MKNKRRKKWWECLKSKELKNGLGIAAICLQLYLKLYPEHETPTYETVITYEAPSAKYSK